MQVLRTGERQTDLIWGGLGSASAESAMTENVISVQIRVIRRVEYLEVARMNVSTTDGSNWGIGETGNGDRV